MRIFSALAILCTLIFLAARPFALLVWDAPQSESVNIPVQVAALDNEPPPATPPPPAEDLAPESEQNSDSLTDMGFGSSFDGSGPAVSGLAGSSGGSSSLQQVPAKVVRRVEPEYPPQARNTGVEGLVVIKLRIGSKGELVDTQVIQSEPKGVFDQSALQAVAKWSFKPAVQGGTTISAFITQKIRFRLEQ